MSHELTLHNCDYLPFAWTLSGPQLHYLMESSDSVTAPMAKISLPSACENEKVRENNMRMHEAAATNSYRQHCNVQRGSLLSAFQEGVAVVRLRYPMQCVIQ